MKHHFKSILILSIMMMIIVPLFSHLMKMFFIDQIPNLAPRYTKIELKSVHTVMVT